MIDGQVTQVVVGARELNPANLPQKSWESQRLIYTHGYGVAMAPANEVPDNEEASFLVGGLPVEVNDRVGVDLDDERARLYYSENPAGYAIVNTAKQEIGFQQVPEYQGDTGVGIGSYLRRAAFALRFQDINPLISGSIGGDSRILFVRGVQERLQKVAPFLHFDADPYPVVLDGRVVYLVDAYTTSDRYPYAERVPSSGLPAASGLRHSFNYVRNSVKAVVDAYDGSVQLYVVPGPDGAIDPIARAYEKAFPRLFQPLDEMPEQLRSHLRHPEDLYRVQTTVYGRYRVDEPDVFYSGTRQWAVAQRPPRDVTAAAAATTNRTPTPTVPGQLPEPAKERVPPQYVLMTLPGESQTDYVNFRSFVPVSEDDAKEELTGFMAAKPNGALAVYNVPGQDAPGPSLVASSILSDQDVSREVTLLGQQGSTVEFGNLLAVPVDRSLLWVLPLYVSARGQTQVPKMTQVVVVYNQAIRRANTVGEALIELFGPESTTGVESPIAPAPSGSPPPANGTTTTTQPAPSTRRRLRRRPRRRRAGRHRRRPAPRRRPPWRTWPARPRTASTRPTPPCAAATCPSYQQKLNQARDLVNRINQELSSPNEQSGGRLTRLDATSAAGAIFCSSTSPRGGAVW